MESPERLKLLYEISRELTATHDLTTLLQRLLQHVQRATQAESGSVLLLDRRGRPLDGVLLYRQQTTPHALPQLLPMFQQGIAGWVARQRQPVLIEDTSTDARWKSPGGEEAPARKSAIAVPLMAREQLLGVLTIARPLPACFTPADLAWAQSIAEQASMAVLNARLLAEARQRNQHLLALVESAFAIGQSLEPRRVLQRILRQVRKALNVEAASLALMDEEKRRLVFRAAAGRGARRILGMSVPLGTGIAGWVAQHRQAVIVPRAAADSRFYDGIDRRIGFKTKAIACVPVLVDERLLGVIEAINPQERDFGEDTLVLLKGIASLAGLAIHHAQLFDTLRAAEARYRTLFEQATDMVLLSDEQGRILEANRRARQRFRLPAHHIQNTVFRLLPLRQDLLGENFAVLHTGKVVRYEAELSLPQATLPVEITAQQIVLEGRTCIQWVLRDIQMHRDLDRLRDELTTMIYHDLRAPLSNLTTSLDVLTAMLQTEDASVQSLLQIAMRSVERMRRLTDSLLDMSRLEAGKPVTNRQAIAPRVLAQEAQEAILPLAQNKQIRITSAVPASLPQVYVDDGMIRRVLINLLENAVKYTPEGGHVHLGAASEGNHVRFWVQDTGPGIPPQDQQRIFNKYFRLPSDTGQSVQGIGLGLAFCKLAVEGHGGRIGVVSQPGQGARFHFTVPVATPEQRRSTILGEEDALEPSEPSGQA